ncbi:MAG: tetratricopeptide repeat protein [Alphaproteobacteria bacterium]|nr:MAG: tetratricopeptide repeat protein [Alphaproteobacteria bacterium]
MRRRARPVTAALGVALLAVAVAAGAGRAQTQPPAQDSPPAAPAAAEDPRAARAARLDALFAELADPATEDWEAVEQQIWSEWSHSGSAAMDLLLRRGRKALEAKDTARAIALFSALVDHAPDFAEGWNARATAFYMADRYGEALADIARALALEPRHFGALTGLGMILEESGFPERALQAFRAAHAIHPHRPSVNEAIERLELKTRGRAL